ncbi:Succinate dehydrogenase flavin-adding protein, antitoxin of CptAB toxin-antitoxin [hydrothermal vent metagenome]|uniref:Succinate dehydrogenase flavin-adding protein, antitoxin of CptAB toxin-antitoxin n=1 Tax=hydrothermal vent metagenome TaxID=652676 RepID=A0A3B0S594_9ZZZZ
MSEAPEHRLKRLRMRSIRRGIKEMDLILGNFADQRLVGLSADDLELYDALLSENDHDLYQWVTGQMPPPDRFSGLIAQISGLVGVHPG